jgi:uncharacterized protein YndB with AHSA1/START domain
VTGEYTTSVRIDAPPGAVFPYLTDAALLVRWMGDRASLDAVPGGRYAVDVSGVPVRGEFVTVDPPHRVVFTWGALGNDALPPGSTTVEVVLRSDGDGTVVELTHRALPEDQVPQHGLGWGHYLPRLAAAAGGGEPGADAGPPAA